MNEAHCQRCTTTLEQLALGEPVTTAERSFAQRHLRQCLECAVEESLWRALELPADPQPEPPPSDEDRALVERFITAFRADRGDKEAPDRSTIRPLSAASPRRRWPLATAALVAALAASAVLAWRLGPFAPPNEPATPPRAEVQVLFGGAEVRAAASAGQPRPRGRPAVAGEKLDEGTTLATGPDPVCLQVGPNVTACLAPGTLLTIGDAILAHRRLDLESGKVVVSLSRQPPGTTFSVETRDGTVTAVGTAFSVEVVGPGRSIARVLRGTVAVHGRGGEEERLTANEAMGLGETTRRPLSADEERADLSLLEPMPVRGDAPAALSPPAPPPAPAPAPSRSAPRPSATAAVDTPPPAAELLRSARALRNEGRAQAAAEVYRRLGAAHPGSAEARTALLSLGELELGALGDPAAALRSFDAYLASGGGLRQEASYGRIRALRALGKVAEERAAITSFLASYPESMQLASLRERLAALDRAAP